MQPVTTERVAMVCLSVCLSADHAREPCKDGWTGQDASWVGHLGGPMEPLWDEFQIPKGEWAILRIV